MQSANKAWWRDVKVCRSKDVPWRIKSRRMVEHDYPSGVCIGPGPQKNSRQNQMMGDKGDESFVPPR